ncbi:hypothetical protein DPMN_101023 [Dreissena polymorpha]|uniref:Uncharacterized protein n=1 Tax=Dreissena polymorpha TaxID=45954 RepID=A0A9D4LIJ0_DREPO|nr:hypothetical protein DPMN_101023 [Dreissena polymorpha]
MLLLRKDTTINKITKKANSTLGFLRRNLKHCPESCRKTAYFALIRTTLEYSSIVWDPLLQKDIDKIEKIQKQSARFITGDYYTKTPGYVTNMLKSMKIPPLQERRKANRLIFFFKVVEGLVPAMPSQDFLTPVRQSKRRITPKHFKDFKVNNIVEQYSVSHQSSAKPNYIKTHFSLRH